MARVSCDTPVYLSAGVLHTDSITPPTVWRECVDGMKTLDCERSRCPWDVPAHARALAVRSVEAGDSSSYYRDLHSEGFRRIAQIPFFVILSKEVVY